MKIIVDGVPTETDFPDALAVEIWHDGKMVKNCSMYYLDLNIPDNIIIQKCNSCIFEKQCFHIFTRRRGNI